MTTVLQRRIFMFIFIFIFLIIGPTIIFLAKGYRFDLTKGIFVYSGSITIKGTPSEMDMFLNDKQVKDSKLNIINNSYTINSLRPGKYNLKCQKEGHSIWEKNIEVHSGISTEFWNVLLFDNKEKHPEKLTGIEVAQFFLSPRNKEEIIFFGKDNDRKNVYLLDTKKNETKEIYSTEEFDLLDSSSEENIEWSTDNNMLLIPFSKEGEKEYIIAQIQSDDIKQSVSLNEQFNQYFKNQRQETQNNIDETGGNEAKDQEIKNIHKARWMFNKNGELVILTKDKKLYYYYLGRPEKTILIDENVNAFDFAGNRIYYSLAPHNIIWEIKNDNIESKRQITKKSFCENNNGFIKLIAYDEYRIAIIDENNNLIIYNEEKEKGEIFEEIVQSNTQDLQFSDDGKKILFWTKNEIWFLMLRKWEVQPIRNKNDKFLVTRFSTIVNNVQWMDNYENIIFSVNDEIKSAEIDLRDKANITTVFQNQSSINPREIFYNKKNQTLYFKDNNFLNSLLIIEKETLFPI